MPVRLLCYLYLLSISVPLWAQDLSTGEKTPKETPKSTLESPKRIEALYFNIGTHTEFFNSVQTDSSGGVRKFDFKTPTVGLGASIPFGKHDLRFLPEVNWVLPKTSGDSRIIKNLIMLRGDIGLDPWEWLRLRLGTSLMWLNQHGRGGKAEMDNGNSTSTFYYPNENRSSLNNTLDLGAELRHNAWALRLQTYIYSVFVEERRQVSYTLFVSYYWDP